MSNTYRDILVVDDGEVSLTYYEVIKSGLKSVSVESSTEHIMDLDPSTILKLAEAIKSEGV